MPTTRRRRARGRAVLTLDSIGIEHILDFIVAWRPPTNEFAASRSRWQTWEEFVTEWGMVRDEFFARDDVFGKQDGEPVFAEWLWQEYGGQAPPPLEQLEVSYSPYPVIRPAPKCLVKWYEYREPFRRAQAEEQERRRQENIARDRRGAGLS